MDAESLPLILIIPGAALIAIVGLLVAYLKWRHPKTEE
jgi:hypothetical protein